MPRRAAATALMLVLLLTAAPLPVQADAWETHAKACAAALRSKDTKRWAAAAQSLIGADHPAALDLLLRLYAKTKAAEMERIFDTRDIDAQFVRYMPELTNVRSVRFLFERIEDTDEHVAEMAAWALKDRVGLHALEHRLRVRFELALRRRRFDVARRYAELLKYRLHVGDLAWIRELGSKLPKSNSRDFVQHVEITRDLRSAYPSLELRREEDPTDDIPGQGVAQAAELNAALDTIPDVPAGFTFTGWAALKELDLWFDAVHEAYQERVRRLLAHAALEPLTALHAAVVAREYARMHNHDTYFAKKNQTQKFDRRAGRTPRDTGPLVVNLALPPVVRQVRVLTSMRTWLLKHAQGQRVIGPPFHAELFELNAGRIATVDSIAFTARDRQRIDLAQEVRTYNRTVTGVRPAERENARYVNDYRADYGLLPLRLDVDLCLASRRHSAYQRSRGAIAHTFPNANEPHGRTPKARMAKAGYPAGYAGGENVYMGSPSPKDAFVAWRGSPAHRRNMLQHAWREIGVGVDGVFWTQNFGIEPYDQDHDADE